MEALLALTPVLLGVAVRAVEQYGEDVPLAQLRLLRALAELGATPSTVLAARLGTAASSVTRLGDRLEAAGYLRRRREPPDRSVVRLELTAAGRELVGRVEVARRGELAALVERLPACPAGQLAAALPALLAAAASEHPGVTSGTHAL